MIKNANKSSIRVIAFLVLTMSLMLSIGSNSKPPKLKDYRDGYVYMPEAGFVPDDSTAIKIAEAVWLPLYGEHIYSSRPFVAHLTCDSMGDSLWIVEGTLPEEFMLGETPYAEIKKSDACIIRVTHGK